ncbi:MAG: sensor histidine kinase [Saprospiraceae bacterium]|nr:sensor histidine kinase [Candidatus Vicinibacter affinis]
MNKLIQNILHNAVQYAPEGTQIKIDLAYQIDKCIIIISDQEKDFRKKEIHLVFDKF